MSKATMARGLKKAVTGTIEGAAQMATIAAVGPIAASATIAGGALKHTAKGIGRGFKTIGGMRTKMLGETAKEAVEEVSKSGYKKKQVMGGLLGKDVSFSNKDGKYYRQVGKYDPIELTADQYRMHIEGNDMELAQQLAEAADSWSLSDVSEWASNNQGKAMAIAAGVGVGGGALLFGGDDDEDDY